VSSYVFIFNQLTDVLEELPAYLNKNHTDNDDVDTNDEDKDEDSDTDNE
jgi:hypothetical protein